jgi:hypothetical protein
VRTQKPKTKSAMASWPWWPLLLLWFAVVAPEFASGQGGVIGFIVSNTGSWGAWASCSPGYIYSVTLMFAKFLLFFLYTFPRVRSLYP